MRRCEVFVFLAFDAEKRWREWRKPIINVASLMLAKRV